MYKFLFFDHMLLESIKACRHEFFPAKKHRLNPLLKPEYPHEHSTIQLYGSVIRSPDSGLYKMWYSAYGKRTSTLCLATSEDGIEWAKPSLDVVSGTNIVIADTDGHQVHGPSIIEDQDDPREDRRYKLIMWPLKQGRGPKGSAIWAYHSADGVHWVQSNAGLPLMREYSDCHLGLCRDPKTKLYHATLRRKTGRRIWLSTSENFIDWSEPELIFEPDLNDPLGLEFYGMQIAPYGPFTLGLLNRYFTDPDERSGRKMKGHLDIALAFSRGFSCWKMVERKQAFISNGGQGVWDGGMTMPATAPVFNNGEVQYFYSGSVLTHGEVNPESKRCIGMASVAIDRWSGLSAGAEVGEIVTKIFKLHGEGLSVNARIASGGLLQVGLADEFWQDLPEFSPSDCLPLSGDCLKTEVRWKNAPDWSSVLRKHIRIKIAIQNATLFALSLPNGREARTEADFLEFTGTGLDTPDGSVPERILD